MVFDDESLGKQRLRRRVGAPEVLAGPPTHPAFHAAEWQRVCAPAAVLGWVDDDARVFCREETKQANYTWSRQGHAQYKPHGRLKKKTIKRARVLPRPLIPVEWLAQQWGCFLSRLYEPL